MPTSQILKPIRGRRMRLTRTDVCGVPVVGPATTGVSKGFVSVGLSLQYEEGETIRQANAAGDFEVNELPDAQLVGVQTSIAFVGVQPDYVSMITNFPTIQDFQAAAVGFTARGGVPITNGFALETWTDMAGAGACSDTGRAYGYLLLPYLRGGQIQDFTIENGLANFTIQSNTLEGSKWGKGPYNVQESGAAVNGVYPAGKLLEAVTDRDHFKLFRTLIAPPPVFDGLSALAAA